MDAATLNKRIVHCFADDGHGNTCALPKGHTGPHGYYLKESTEAKKRDARRDYFRLWKADTKRN